MKDRVKKVQDHYKLTQKHFAAALGVAEATISSIYRGRTAPTNNLIQAIHAVYPAINISWLMFGEGEMLLPLSPATSNGGDAASDPAASMTQGAGAGIHSDGASNNIYASGMGNSSAEARKFAGAARNFSSEAGGSLSDVASLQGAVGQNGGFLGGDEPSLFDAPSMPNQPRKAQNMAQYPGLPAELQLAEALSQLKKANEVDRPVRKVKEIRVFFDDGTFEAFVPSGR